MTAWKRAARLAVSLTTLHPILQILYRGFNRARLLAYRPKAACEYSGMRVSEIEKRDPHFFD